MSKAIAIRNNFEPWGSLVELIEQHLAEQLGRSQEIEAPTRADRSSSTPRSKQFAGTNAEKANGYLEARVSQGLRSAGLLRKAWQACQQIAAVTGGGSAA